MLRRGRENFAEPLNLLNEAADLFEMRQMRALRNLSDNDNLFIGIDGDNDFDGSDAEMNAQRLALGQLTGGVLILIFFCHRQR